MFSDIVGGVIQALCPAAGADDLFPERVIIMAGVDVAVRVGVDPRAAQVVVCQIADLRRLVGLIRVFGDKFAGRIVNENDRFAIRHDLLDPLAVAIVSKPCCRFGGVEKAAKSGQECPRSDNAVKKRTGVSAVRLICGRFFAVAGNAELGKHLGNGETQRLKLLEQ